LSGLNEQRENKKKIKRTRFVRTVAITGMAVFMMATSARAVTVTDDTNKAGIVLDGSGLTVHTLQGFATPHTLNTEGAPSKRGTGDFVPATFTTTMFAKIVTPRQSTVQGPGWATILLGIGGSLIILSRYGRKKIPLPAHADCDTAGKEPNVLRPAADALVGILGAPRKSLSSYRFWGLAGFRQSPTLVVRATTFLDLRPWCARRGPTFTPNRRRGSCDH
jgi:hypothetical protein